MGRRGRGNLIVCIVLAVVLAVLIVQLPRILGHSSSPDRHDVLYFNKSFSYWLFIVAYISVLATGTVLWTLLLMNRPMTWLTTPLRRFMSTPRSYTWSEVIVFAVITLVLACVPEMLARGAFVVKYAAPSGILIPYLTRFDRTVALYRYTRPAGDTAHADIVAFRDNTFVYRPYVGYTTVPEFRPAPAPAKNAFRVFFVGGSAMQLSAAPAIRDLRARFDDLKCNIEVINAGRSGYVSGQEVVMILMEILALQPDLIVVFNGYNDITRVEEGEEPGAPEFTRAMETAFTAGSRIYQHLLNDLAQRSFLVQFLAGRFVDKRSGIVDRQREVFERAVELYASNVQKMTRIAQSYGSGLIVAIQPSLFLRDRRGSREAEIIAKHPERAHLYQRYFPELIERARTIGHSERVLVRDMSRIFSGVPGDVFYDGVHFYGANAAVRNALRSEFEELILSHPGACDRLRR
jgi:lysophospholipase L1-like esterase